jgi:ubiquinone/menaquinone biosynthesis C-methylase UbiE
LVFSIMIAKLYIRLLRWAFARFYREFAWTYDVVAWIVSRGLWRHWIVAVVPQLRGNRVLELGSGTGYLQLALFKHGISTIGLDASPQMLRLARRKVAQAGGSAVLLRGHAQHLPFPNSSFSDIVATFPAEYIVERATIDEAWRVLESGGQFILIDAGQWTKQDAYTAAVDVAYRATHQVRYNDPRPQLLVDAGFHVTEQWVAVQNSQVQMLIASKLVGVDEAAFS